MDFINTTKLTKSQKLSVKKVKEMRAKFAPIGNIIVFNDPVSYKPVCMTQGTKIIAKCPTDSDLNTYFRSKFCKSGGLVGKCANSIKLGIKTFKKCSTITCKKNVASSWVKDFDGFVNLRKKKFFEKSNQKNLMKTLKKSKKEQLTTLKRTLKKRISFLN